MKPVGRVFDPVADWVLLGGMINGHVTWSLQLVSNYLLDAAACDAAAAGATELAAYEVGMVAVTLLTAAITAGFMIACIAAFRRLRAGEVALDPDEARRRLFMAAAGIALSGLFVLVIIFGGTQHFVLAPCIRG